MGKIRGAQGKRSLKELVVSYRDHIPGTRIGCLNRKDRKCSKILAFLNSKLFNDLKLHQAG